MRDDIKFAADVVVCPHAGEPAAPTVSAERVDAASALLAPSPALIHVQRRQVLSVLAALGIEVTTP